MSKYISLRPQDGILDTYLRFSVTNTAIKQLADIAGDPLPVLTALSKSKLLLAYSGSKPSELRIYTDTGVMSCVASDDGGFLLKGFYRNSLIDQNNAMKFGVCFTVTKGIIVKLRLRDYDYFFDLVDGKQYSSARRANMPPENQFFDRQNAAPATQKMFAQVTQSMEPSDKAAVSIQTAYEPEKKLANLLQLADDYAVLASDLEERNAMAQGRIQYHHVEAVQYDRIDRVVYQFGVDQLDENVFKAGVQVEIHDQEDHRHTAEILDLVRKDADAPVSGVKLLFNEQLSVKQFPGTGFFSLSFSTVNRDVQQAAIERIRTGQAAATYMDAVLGRNEPQGFDNKDLSQVLSALQQKQYPPNESQLKAIQAGINTKDVFLVMGPPGTGKTTVILEWVKYFVLHEHLRVLVSSQNNKAVDNVLARIAEEEGIDMIRIGSESKLQADVVPYMFENRVAELRRKIEEQSSAHLTAIDRSVAAWKEYINRLDQVASMEQRAATSRQALREHLKQQAIPLKDELKRFIGAYNVIRQDKLHLAQTIRTLSNQLARHDGANVFVRLLTKIIYNRRRKQLQATYAAFTQKKAQEQSVCTRYTQLRKQYVETIQRIYNDDYYPYYIKWSCFSVHFRNLANKPARDPGDLWDLFREARDYEIRTTQDILPQKVPINQGIVRAAALRTILSDWQAEMGGKQNYALNEIVLESVNLVGATCIGINSQKRFAHLNFDVTIIDEAGQIQIHNALVPMSVSDKLIMLGDHKQIPPSADQTLVDLCEENGVRTDLLKKSLFEKMYNDLPETNKMMLDTQYRMPAEIADTISEWFYDGQYYSPPFKQGLGSLLPRLSNRPYVIIDTAGEANRFERTIAGAGCDNALEASIIATILREYAKDGENDLSEIGVISAYKFQVKLIKNQLKTFLDKGVVNEMVATLDSYQGQERNIIFYSFAKSSRTKAFRRRIGFLNELRRLNVAMTRCKKMLVLVGDMDFLSSCRHCDRDEAGEDIYEGSERQFSDFVGKMLSDVDAGRGEHISYRTFMERYEGGKA